MIFICFAALTAHALFGTAWSNHCDPGNERLGVLESDPVVSFRARGELFSMESKSADNSWLCTGPDVSVNHYGDTAALYAELRAKFTQSGWTDEGNPGQVDPEWSFFVKDSAGVDPLHEIKGYRISGMVRKHWFSVEVRVSSIGAHMGEMGFQ
ncbi:MAG: hypothetical protein PVS3B2_18410 [Candidatus Dormibacteraceae bacterium]